MEPRRRVAVSLLCRSPAHLQLRELGVLTGVQPRHRSGTAPHCWKPSALPPPQRPRLRFQTAGGEPLTLGHCCRELTRPPRPRRSATHTRRPTRRKGNALSSHAFLPISVARAPFHPCCRANFRRRSALCPSAMRGGSVALDPRSRPRREAALPLGRNQWKVGQTFRNRVGPSKGGAQKGFRWARSRGPTAFGRCDGELRVVKRSRCLPGLPSDPGPATCPG